MKILKFIKGTLVTAIILLLLSIIFVNVNMFIQREFMDKKAPSIFGYSSAIVVSGSMHPYIETNDMIIIKSQPEYNINDVVAFQTEKSIVTHRLIDKKEDGFVSKGDANNTEDTNLVKPENIVGKVILIIPKMGKAVSIAQSPLGMFVLVFSAFMIIIFPTKKKEDIEKEIEKVEEN